MTTESMKKYNTYGANIGAVAATQPITPAAVTSGGGSVVPTYADYLSGKGTVAANAAPVSASYAGNVAAAAEAEVPTDGSGAAAVQPAAPATEPVDTYEQWLIKNAETYKDVYDRTVESIDANKQAAIDAAEQQRVRAEQNAETERQRAIIDSKSSYAQNLAQYGRAGEQMGAMGLTGSGYGEYLNSQAYAQQRAEQQGANAAAEAAKRDAQYVKDQTEIAAEQQANSDKLSASLSYEQNLNKNAGELAKYQQERADAAAAKAEAQEATRKEAYANLLTAANNGDYSADQIRALAGKYGLSEQDITELVGAAEKTESAKAAQAVSEVMTAMNESGSDFDTGYIDLLLQQGVISQAQADDLISKYNNNLVSESTQAIADGISNGDYETIEATLENADALYKDGKISQTDYQNLYYKGQTAAVDGIVEKSYDNKADSINDFAELETELADMYSAGKLSQSQYNALKAKIDAKNGSGVRVYVQGLGTGRKNDDIDITVNADIATTEMERQMLEMEYRKKGVWGLQSPEYKAKLAELDKKDEEYKKNGTTARNKDKEYDLLCGDEITDPSAKAALNKFATGKDQEPSNGTLIVYAGNMYIFTKKGWRTVESDHSNVSDAIKDYLNSTKKTSSVTYASDSDIASKASSGTLTYNDVAKYNAGIRTQREFARGGDDKTKYGTYQAYLQAMYEKYKK